MQIQVCLSPALLPQYNLENKIVIVTDVLRATSTMVAALEVGVMDILPVSARDDAMSFIGEKNHIVAGERDGKKVEGFDLGNSPLGIKNQEDLVKGKTLVMTTTNGTKAIKLSLEAKYIFIGALTNVAALSDVIKNYEEDVIVLCAGWKNRVNLEDTLFAGAFCEAMKNEAEIYGDAAIMSQQLFVAHQDDLFTAVKGATHFKRLKSHGIEDDVRYCMSLNISNAVPYLKDGFIVV